MTQTEGIKMVVTHDRQERKPITAVWRNGGFSASYEHLWCKSATTPSRKPLCTSVKTYINEN